MQKTKSKYFSKEHSQDLPRKSKIILIIYSIAALSLLIITMVNLILPNWFRYCWWDFGLVYASTFTNISNFQNENSIGEIYNDVCGVLEDLVDYYCPGFCDNIDYFESAGLSMLFFGIFSLISLLGSFTFHIWLIFKPLLKFQIIWFCIFLPFFWFLLGIIVYYSVGDFSKIQDTKSEDDAHDFEIKQGMILSFIVLFFNILLTIFGCLMTKNIFNRKQGRSR